MGLAWTRRRALRRVEARSTSATDRAVTCSRIKPSSRLTIRYMASAARLSVVLRPEDRIVSDVGVDDVPVRGRRDCNDLVLVSVAAPSGATPPVPAQSAESAAGLTDLVSRP